MHVENNSHYIPSHFDLPDWQEIKLTALSWASNNPAVSASTNATIIAKKAIEQSTGKKLTSAQVDEIQTKNATIAQTEVSDSIVSVFTRLKWIIIITVVLILVIKFK